MGDTFREASLAARRRCRSDRIEHRCRWGGLVSAALRQPRLVSLHRRRRDVGTNAYIAFTPKMFMTAAWNTQVWGREVGNPVSLNLVEFQRNRARLKFAWEFDLLERLTRVCCTYDDEKTDIGCCLRDLDGWRVSVSAQQATSFM